MKTISLQVEHKSSFSFALEQSGVPLIGPISITNNNSSPLEDAILEVALYPDLGEPVTLQLPKIHGGEEFKVDVIDLRLPAGRLEKTLEAERIILECSLKQGDTVLEKVKKEVNLLAYNDYSLKELYLELLACFVTPNHPVVMQVLKQVREILKRNIEDNSLDGYQTGDRNKVYEMTKALYETFRDFGISYINPPASFEGNQKIRFPDRVLHDQMGTCLDLSVLAAACLEQMGLAPLIIVVRGHAFIGVWLEEEKHNYNPVIDEPLKLINLVQAASLLMFDSSTYAACPQPPFKVAIEEALSYINNVSLQGAIDIRVCREKGYKPLPIRMAAVPIIEPDREEIASLAQQILRQAALAQQTGVIEETNKQNKKEELPESVKQRFQRWKASLLDLSMKNKLLNLANLDVSKLIAELLVYKVKELLADLINSQGESEEQEIEPELLLQLRETFKQIRVDKVIGRDFKLSQQFDLLSYIKINEPLLQKLLLNIIEEREQELYQYIYRDFIKKIKSKKQTFLLLDIPTQLLAQFEDYLASGKQIEILPVSDREDARNQQLLQKRSDEHEILARKASDLAKSRCQAIQGLGLSISCDEGWLYTVGKLLEREAAIAQEETGASTLYLALGLLQWTEKGSSLPKLAPLFLYPIDLSTNRTNYRVSFRLGENDPLGNVTLVEKIRQDYGIDLKVIAEPPEDESGFNITEALKQVRKIIANLPGWLVIDAAVITTFSFGKFLMWKDLQDNANTLLKNPLVQHIASGGLQPLIDPVGEIPPKQLDTVPLVEIPTVVDADSSQLAAVYASLKGRNFVLQGPPGTGKSQTITNLIAAFLAQGKSVLFIAEKMAALEVVQRRLNSVGLGDFYLELHGNTANRKKVIDSLAKSLQQERLCQVNWEQATKEIEQLKQQLAAYPQALHQKHPVGQSLYEILGNLIPLESSSTISLPEIDLDNLTEQQLKQILDLIEQYIRRSLAVRLVEKHPWKISDRSDWSLAVENKIIATIEQLLTDIATLKEELNEFLENLSIELKPSLDILRKLPAIGLDMAAGTVHSAALDRENWTHTYDFVNNWLNLSRQNLEQRHQLQRRWRERIYTVNLEKQIEVFKSVQQKHPLWRWLFQFTPRFLLRSVGKGKLPSNGQILQDLQLALELRKSSEIIEEQKWDVEYLFSPFWTTANTLDELQSLLDRSHRFYNSLTTLSPEAIQALRLKFTDTVASFPELRAPSEQLKKLVDVLEKRAGELETMLEIRGDIIDSSIPDFLDRFHNLLLRLKNHQSEFKAWCRYREVCQELERQHLTPLFQANRRGEISLEDLPQVLLKSILEPLFIKHFDSHPTLRQFEGEEQSQKIEKFRQLQQEYLRISQAYIRASLGAKLPAASVVFDGSELGILKRESQKQRGHLPIRSLFQKIPNLLPKLKPCLLMSPLSVAQYLPADGTSFDLVVFDEASQVETHDAIGAIARGKQVIIVGDSKQMPPTNFFGRSSDDENDFVELESLLDEAIASQFPEQMLQWHYRSKHETLIDFSNKNYYSSKLNIFPAAQSFSVTSGLKWHQIADGFYKSGDRTNEPEARELVSFLIEQLRSHQPQKRTFGVITFSIPQKLLIDELLDEARRQHPEIEPHFAKDFDEKVFVKNLENVQGDERDEILFSICYAPDRNGRMSMNFGALNRQGGERRLNVAVTRARQSLHIFSTITAESIDLSRTNAMGISHFKDFLEFAKKQGTVRPENQLLRTNDFDSNMEREIYEALVSLGYKVTCKVGCGDYRIDLAVLHPVRLGAYVLGIETDGKTYEAAATVQDRERLRQNVLASLGWRIHRIWCLDWRYKRERELERLQQAIETAITELAAEPSEFTQKQVELKISGDVRATEIPPLKASFITTQPQPPIVSPSPFVPYQVASLAPVTDETHLIYKNEAIPLIQQRILSLATVEAPIAIADIVSPVAQCWGFKSISPKLKEWIADRINALVKEDRLWLHEDFIWLSQEQRESWSVARKPTDDKKRKIEQIPLEEIAVALMWIVSQSLSIEEDSLYKETASSFGIKKINENVKQKMQTTVDLVCRRGQAKRESSRVFWVEASTLR